MSSASEFSQVDLSVPVARSTRSAEPIFTTMRREVVKGVGMWEVMAGVDPADKRQAQSFGQA